MKKGMIFIAAIILVLAAGFGIRAWHGQAGKADGPGPAQAVPVHNHEHRGDSMAPTAKTMYNCAMHPNYISDKPGNCPICGMQLVPMDKETGNKTEAGHEQADGGRSQAPTSGGRHIAYYRDAMNPMITSDKPGKASDGMDLVPVYEGDDAGKGVHIDPATVQNMGVRTETVARRVLKKEIRASGSVKADESRIFQVNARVMGYVESLQANVTGQKVSKGQKLMEIYSPDLVSTQEEYLQALRYAQATARNPGAPGNPDATGARELAESSRRRLLNWGVAAGDIDALEKLGHARNTLPISSPGNGVILEKMVVAGQNITPGMPLYKIADLSKVWVVANIYQRDLAVVKPGADAEVELNYLQGKPFHGRLTFISPVLDEQTKTVEVRIEIPNTPALDLKPEMFATVTIHSPSARNALAVPEQAVIRSGRRNLVIIATGGGYFEPRDVQLGSSADDYVEVLDGLREGETIVVSSQFLIDSESNLKAAVRQMQSVPSQESDTGSMPVTGNGK